MQEENHSPDSPSAVPRLCLTSLLLAIAMLLLNSALGAESEWTRQGGPEGGWVAKVAIDPASPGTLYAALVNGGGLWKSTNGGASWRSILPFASLWTVTLDPSNPKVVYAGGTIPNGPAAESLARSEDGGETWEFLTPPSPDCPYIPDTGCIAISPTAANTIVALSVCGAFRTSDGGATWSTPNADLPTFNSPWCDLAFDPNNPSTVYAGTYGGAFRSNDAGLTWFPATQGLTTDGIHTFVIPSGIPDAIYDAIYDGVFKSTDGGSSWISKSSGLPRAVYALAGDPSSPGTLYAGVLDGGVYKTVDGGDSWTPANTGVTGSWVNSLAVDPSHPASLYAGTIGGAVFKSTDRATTWLSSSTGIIGTNIISIATSPIDPSTLLVGTGDSGIFLSLDAGRSWAGISSGLSAHGPPYRQIWSLAIDPTAPCTIFAGTNENAGVFRTLDCGGHWTKVASGLPVRDGIFSSVVIDPAAPYTVYAGAELGAGVFKTVDRGGSWAPASQGLEGLGVHQLRLDPQDPATIFAGTSKGVFKSTDGARTWVARSSGLEHDNFYDFAIDPVVPTTLWTTASDGFSGSVYQSTNGGATWTPRNQGLPGNGTDSLALDSTAPGTLFAANAFDGVFKTTDAGQTWARMADGPDGAAKVAQSAHDALLYAVGVNDSGGFIIGAGSYVFAYGPPPENAQIPLPPQGPWLTDERLPGFQVKARITSGGTERAAHRVDTCIGETLCLSGAVPERAELFVRVVGPKPNGRLWPTLVKFSTSQIEVWVRQLSTGLVRYYNLPAVAPTGKRLELAGLADKQGFPPPGTTNPVAAPLLSASPENRVASVRTTSDPPPPAVGPWLTGPGLPGFRVKAQITAGGQSRPAMTEDACIPETLCLSGAVPGRPELFVRVVGPKPNGYLWPTLVKFSTSQVEVWIQQLSTEDTRYYLLEPVDPSGTLLALDGLADKLGFTP